MVGERNALLAAVIRASLDCVVVIDEDGVVLEWNPAAEATFGYSREEAIGREIAGLIIPNRHKAAHAHGFARYMAGGKARVLGHRVEIEGLHRDGREIPVELSINEVHLGGRRVFTASLRDLSQKRATESELKRVQALVAGFFDHVPAAMYLKDREGRFVLANRAADTLWDIAPGSAIGRISYDMIDEPGASMARAQDRAVIENGDAVIAEQTLRRGDKVRHTLTTRFPIRDERGETTHVGAVLIDISDRVEADKALRETRAMLSAFFDNAPVGMLVKGLDGRYEYANRFALDFFGKPTDEVIQSLPEDHFRSDLSDALAEVDSRVAQSGAPEVIEKHYVADTGLEYDAVTVRFPLRDLTGQTTKIGIVLLDTTGQRKAERELEESRHRLMQAEKVNALGSLLAGVSHELNNPLAVAVGEAILLADEAEDTPFAKRAGRIRRAAERCSRIVQTFLAMARQKQPNLVRTQVNDIVRAALDLTSYAMSSNGIIVTSDLREGLPTVRADEDLLHQVLVNLLVNSQQALAECADAVIALSTRMENGEVVLEVRDNGPGIPPEVAARVFEPFFTTKPQGTGTGIGLSFSLGVVESHGGTLALEPVDDGACFVMRLPVANGPPEILADLASEYDASATGRALVIDDEPDFAEMLADFLAREGYDAAIARDGNEAVEMLRNRSFDLIVSDLRMPGLDGPQLFDWLSAHRPDLVPRTGFITGDTLAARSDHFLRSCGRPFATKPFTAQSLRALLAEISPRV